MTDTYGDAIDLTSIVQNWPASQTMPQIIAELGEMLKPWPWGPLGYWRLKGEDFDEFWRTALDDGTTLDGEFGIFMGFANGTQYAIWYHDDDPPGAHPIVNFCDEGGVTILASNIRAFFNEWATGRGVGWLDPFDYDATPELLAARTAYGAQMLEVINATAEPPAGLQIADLQTRLDATYGRAQAVADEVARQRRLVEVYGDKIDLASPPKYWPPSHPYPQVIADLGALLKTSIIGSVGACSMAGQHMGDGFIDSGADLYDQFGFFLVDHRFSPVAIWYHEGAEPGSEPIIDIGSTRFDNDAYASIVAPNLKAYLNKWATAVEAGDATYSLNEEPEIAAQRPALVAQMRALAARLPDPKNTVPTPDLCAFLTNFRDTSRAQQNADPVLQEIAHILDAHFPAATDPLWNNIFMVTKDNGFDYSLIGQELTEATFPEGKQLTPLLIKIRAERAHGPTKALGPWTSAMLALYPDRRIALEAAWDG